MSSDLPTPFVSADADLRDFDGFMLNVERMLASELWALSTGDEFKAAFALWMRAWKQCPAGSLPDDDRLLAAFSGAGKKWPKVREMALRGFVKCSDQRLYHKTLCEDVKRAAIKKAERHERTKAATEARQRLRDAQRNVERDDQRNVVENGTVTTSQGQGQGQGQGQEETSSLRSDAKKRGTRLTGDWQPSAEDLAYAKSQGMPDAAITREIPNFRDYWIAKPGASGVKLDWPATWRTWVRRACERAGYAPPTANGNGRAYDPADAHDAGLILGVARTRKQWSRQLWGPMPGELGCRIPGELLQPDDGRDWAEWGDQGAGH
jgi:uncharacterized protein YdaU (DUF1376 family)